MDGRVHFSHALARHRCDRWSSRQPRRFCSNSHLFKWPARCILELPTINIPSDHLDLGGSLPTVCSQRRCQHCMVVPSNVKEHHPGRSTPLLELWEQFPGGASFRTKYESARGGMYCCDYSTDQRSPVPARLQSRGRINHGHSYCRLADHLPTATGLQVHC